MVLTRPRSAAARWWFDSLAVGLVALAVWAADLVWIHRETRPPHWDMARHLWTSLLYNNDAHAHRLLPFLQDYHYYPPLVYWSAVAWYHFFGTAAVVAVASNLTFILILVGSVYAIGRRLGGRSVGLAAALLTVSYPMLVTQFKEFQLDAPLTAMVALALCLLIYSEGFKHRRYTLAFGVACGFGMLTKWTFVACLALPVLLGVAQAVAADLRARKPRRLAIVAVAALIAYTICSPWYAANFQQFRIDMKANGAPQAALEGDPLVGSSASNLWYLNNLINQQLFLPDALLALGGLLWLLWRGPKRADRWYLILSVVGIYAVFTAIANKDPRYTLPFLPLLAVISVAWIAALRPRGRMIAVAGFGLYSVLMFTTISFGTKLLSSNVAFAVGTTPVTVYAQRGYIIGPPTSENWQLRQVFVRIAGQPESVRSLAYSGPDTIWFNSWDLAYYSQLYGVAVTSPNTAAFLVVRSATPPAGAAKAIETNTLPDHTRLYLLPAPHSPSGGPQL